MKEQDQLLRELFETAALQRSTFRRFVVALLAAIGASVCCLIKHSVEGGFTTAGWTTLGLSGVATFVGFHDAHELRAIQARLRQLTESLRSLRETAGR